MPFLLRQLAAGRFDRGLGTSGRGDALQREGFGDFTLGNDLGALGGARHQLGGTQGSEVDFAALRAAKLVPSTAKRAKVVVKGEVTKAYTLKGIAATAGAKAAIEAAGGKLAE